MLPLTLAGGAAALTSDGAKLPAAAPVAAAPTVRPILLRNCLRATFGISGMLAMVPFLSGSLDLIRVRAFCIPNIRLRVGFGSRDVRGDANCGTAAIISDAGSPERTRPGFFVGARFAIRRRSVHSWRPSSPPFRAAPQAPRGPRPPACATAAAAAPSDGRADRKPCARHGYSLSPPCSRRVGT